MTQATYLHIADVIQKYRTWVKVVSTDQLVEQRIRQDGILVPVYYQTITLKSYHPRPGCWRTRIWNINEHDISLALSYLCQIDPSASSRADNCSLSLSDVERIIEYASHGIIKLELYDYDS